VKSCVALLLLLLSSGFGFAADSTSQKPWTEWQFLLGEWVGEGTGHPGQGTGGFTFTTDLQGKVLIRKNHADYPATDKRPTFSHSDLMVIYQDAGRTRADYYDSESHVIRYTVALAASHDSATFLSDPSTSAPQFRLTYTLKMADQVSLKFEIAPPGKPFATYIEATAHRK